MTKAFLATVLLLEIAGSGDSSGPWHSNAQSVLEVQPDPRRSQQLDHWPNAADLTRLQSVEGKSKGVILKVLGHPYSVVHCPNGEEVWHYLWCTSCSVSIRHGVCTGTYYDGGY